MRAIWATRGRTWGFRFLLDGDYADPLPVYDRVFAGVEGERTLYVKVGGRVGLRFADPLGRRDAAGRVIPHDFVILESPDDEEPLVDKIDSVDDGLLKVWPVVREVYARIWDIPRPPDAAAIRMAIQRNSVNSRIPRVHKEA